MNKYQVLIKTISGKGGEFWEVFSKMPTEPMKGIVVESSWSLYGYWDFVVSSKLTTTKIVFTSSVKSYGPCQASLILARHQ
jgi:hypothetical protein